MKVNQSPVFKSMVFNCELALLGCDAPKEVSLAVICNLYIFRNKKNWLLHPKPTKIFICHGWKPYKKFCNQQIYCIFIIYLFPRYDHLKITKGTTSISSERAKEYTNFTVPRSFLLELWKIFLHFQGVHFYLDNIKYIEVFQNYKKTVVAILRYCCNNVVHCSVGGCRFSQKCDKGHNLSVCDLQKAWPSTFIWFWVYLGKNMLSFRNFALEGGISYSQKQISE